MTETKLIRNIAVIAHVDHGKTTLVDAILKQTNIFRANQEEMSQERILDTNELERERGITILAKNCSVVYNDVKINIIDTPGHADFSGEVERTLSMADGALLIVDAQEGPMPQTRFVLRKALELGLKIIVVINKIDKKLSQITRTKDKIDDLFLELAANSEQLDFPVLYAVGRDGAVYNELPKDISNTPSDKTNVFPLLDMIISYIDAPDVDPNKPFKMLVSSLDYDSHLGKIVIGTIRQGTIKKNQRVIITQFPDKSFRAENIMLSKGLERVNVEEATSGDIVALSGIPDVQIGMTISDESDTTPYPAQEITKPTLNMTLSPSSSPFVGREGKLLTSRQIEQRLDRELESNLSLKVEKLDGGSFKISGRGELHLAILLETMRREGFEMEVGKPKVINKTIDGVLSEPIEEVNIIVNSEYVGIINQEMGRRQAKLISMDQITESEVEFIFEAPTRVLIGLRSIFMTLTKGTILFSSQPIGYGPVGKMLPKMRTGVLVADSDGDVLSYGLKTAQERGITFVEPGTSVYAGMIVGKNAKDQDLRINVCKGKKLTNMRSKSSDGIINLTPPTIFSLEQSLDFLEDDELLEITPDSLRLRKKNLSGKTSKRVNLN